MCPLNRGFTVSTVERSNISHSLFLLTKTEMSTELISFRAVHGLGEHYLGFIQCTYFPSLQTSSQDGVNVINKKKNAKDAPQMNSLALIEVRSLNELSNLLKKST